MASTKAENLEITRGDQYTYTVNLLNTSGSAFDLTGYKAMFTAIANLDSNGGVTTDPTAAISKTLASVSSPTAGSIVFTLTTTDTNVASGSYHFDVQIVSSGGVPTTVVGPATLIILPDVTRRLS